MKAERCSLAFMDELERQPFLNARVGQRVTTRRWFDELLPGFYKRNGVRRGTVLRITGPGAYLVQWDGKDEPDRNSWDGRFLDAAGIA